MFQHSEVPYSGDRYDEALHEAGLDRDVRDDAVLGGQSFEPPGAEARDGAVPQAREAVGEVAGASRVEVQKGQRNPARAFRSEQLEHRLIVFLERRAMAPEPA